MTLHRRELLASLATVAVAGCGTDGPSGTASSKPGSASPTASESPMGTEPGYASCNPDLATIEERHTAGGIPEPLTESNASSYARELEQDILLPPPAERDGYVSFGSIDAETVHHGYLVTVEVTGGYYNQAGEGTVTVHADLGIHTATSFINEQVVRRAEDTTAELDPRDVGELIVCEQ